MKILITGGAGFVGSHLCEKYTKEGHTVLCLDNFMNGNLMNVRPLLDYRNFKLIKGDANSGKRFYVAAFLAGYIGLSVAATLTGFEFGIQPMIASASDGKPLYAPYPLSIAVPVMALEHLLVFGILEGMVTALILKYFVKHESALVYAMKEA